MRKIFVTLMISLMAVTSLFATEFKKGWAYYEVSYDTEEDTPCVKVLDLKNDVLYWFVEETAENAMEIYYEASKSPSYIENLIRDSKYFVVETTYLILGDTNNITKVVIIERHPKSSYEAFVDTPANLNVETRVIDKSDPFDSLIEKTGKLYENALDKADELLSSSSQ